MSVLPNLVHRFNAIPIKTPASYFVDINKSILKCIWRSKIPQVANTIFKKKNKVGRLTLPKFKTYYKATVFKRVWYWQKKKQRHQWIRIQSPEINCINRVNSSFTKEQRQDKSMKQ